VPNVDDVSGIAGVLLALAIVAALAGAAGLLLLRWYRRSSGIPGVLGRDTEVVASDTGAARSVLLRDPQLGLRGKPDYVLEERDADGTSLLVAMEVKPSRRSARLYESDEVQLGAYVLLLRATHGARAASHGYVRYAERSFRVELTPRLEERVRQIVAAVRVGRRAAVVHRSHDVPARCASCPVRDRCDEALS